MDEKRVVRGQTFAAVGPYTLKTSGWTAVLRLSNTSNPRLAEGDFGFIVTVTPIGVNATDATMTDYLFAITASSSATAAICVRGPQDSVRLEGRLMLTDGSGNVVPSDRFAFVVED